ncbi:MAG TPA: efflux RND transporter periplasmic adaptor subunit [Vicinamibacterales bacterium]
MTALLAGASVTAGAYYTRRGDGAPELTTAAVTRGNVVTTVAATGTLEPVTNVEVGAQVTGIVEALYADFNSMVHKGQLLAKLDQSTFLTSVEQARANFTGAQADAQRLKVASEAANIALTRAQELSSRQLLPAQDLQQAETDARTAAADVAGADAKVAQAKADLSMAEVNLAKTVISSPIDGVVTARNVDVGQTVSANFSAPTLYIIAADLTHMQLDASIDESDLGQIKPGQTVTFRVDAYPERMFRGTLTQIRLNAATVNNVVTYSAMIDAPNPTLDLKPGMTATLSVEVARRDQVLRVPTAALRFKPDANVLVHYVGPQPPASAPAPGKAVWAMNGTAIAPVPVVAGISDGTYTELVGSPIAEGTVVVVRASTPANAPNTPTTGSGNPLLPQRPGVGRRG